MLFAEKKLNSTWQYKIKSIQNNLQNWKNMKIHVLV